MRTFFFLLSLFVVNWEAFKSVDEENLNFVFNTLHNRYRKKMLHHED